jgi:hypothetical protein
MANPSALWIGPHFNVGMGLNGVLWESARKTVHRMLSDSSTALVGRLRGNAKGYEAFLRRCNREPWFSFLSSTD